MMLVLVADVSGGGGGLCRVGWGFAAKRPTKSWRSYRRTGTPR